MKFNKNNIKILLCIIAVITFVSPLTTKAALRGYKAGDIMPEFSVFNINDVNYTYEHDNGNPVLLMFISQEQQGSQRAVTDLNQVISRLGKNAQNLKVTIVVEDSNDSFEESEEFEMIKKFNVIIDPEYKLWGKFGLIATPTIVISDANDRIVWVKAGHNYDFIPNVRTHINKALGISPEDVQDDVEVKTVVNDTIPARVTRHLQMASILSEKGQVESAIAEVSKARELDPNSIKVKLSLAELLCKAKRNQEALDVIVNIKPTNEIERGNVLVLKGWVNQQMGELDAAQSYLLEAISIDKTSIRAFFELGNVYKAQGLIEEAMKAYYNAAAIVLKESKSVQEIPKNQ